MKTLEMKENHRRNGGVYTKLLLSQLPLITNLVPYQSLDNFCSFSYLVSKLFNLKKAYMLMKPLEMKAKLAENKGRHLQTFYYLSC